MKEGHIGTDGSLSDERNNDMTDSWMKVMNGLCPTKKSQNMNTLE